MTKSAKVVLAKAAGTSKLVISGVGIIGGAKSSGGDSKWGSG